MDAAPPSRRLQTLVVVALVLLAVALRIPLVAATDLWIDEAVPFLAGISSWHDVIATVAREAHPPGFHLLVRALFAVLPATPGTLRGLSVVSGVALAVLCFVAPLGRGSLPARLAGAAWLAVHPLAVFYSVEGRPYALLWCLVHVVCWSLLHFDGSRRRAALLACAQVAALSVHHYGVFLLPLWCFAFVDADRRGRLRLGAAALVVLLAWLPWTLFVLPQQVAGVAGNDGFLMRQWETAGPWGVLGQSVRCSFGVAPFPPYLRSLAGLAFDEVAAVTGVVVAFAVVGGVVGGRLRRGESAQPHVPRPERVARFLGCAAALFVIGPWAITATTTPILLAGRHETIVLVPLAALWMLGVDAAIAAAPAGNRRLAVGALGGIVALGGLPLSQKLVAIPPLHQYRPIAQHLSASPSPSSARPAVVVVGLDYGPLAAALHDEGFLGPVRAVPSSIELHPGSWDGTFGDAQQASGVLVAAAVDGAVVVLPRFGPPALQRTMDEVGVALARRGLSLQPLVENGRLVALVAVGGVAAAGP